MAGCNPVFGRRDRLAEGTDCNRISKVRIDAGTRATPWRKRDRHQKITKTATGIISSEDNPIR